MVRDTWRAILVIAVVLALRHEDAVWRAIKRAAAPEPPAVGTGSWGQVPVAPVHGNGYHWPQAVAMPQQQIVITQEPERPLRRVAAAMTEVVDSMIGVVR